MALFGEKLDGPTEIEDPCRLFFTKIVSFIKEFSADIDRRNRRRAEEKRAERVRAQMTILQDAKKKAHEDKLRLLNDSECGQTTPIQASRPTESHEQDPIPEEADVSIDDVFESLQVSETTATFGFQSASVDENMEYIRHTIMGTSPAKLILDEGDPDFFSNLGRQSSGGRKSIGTTRKNYPRTPHSISKHLLMEKSIFESFHHAQAAPSDIVVDEYSMKLKKIGSAITIDKVPTGSIDFDSIYPLTEL